MNETDGAPPSPGTDFIRRQIAADIDSGRYDGRVVTRFPPEPNGYLHVGHAMAIHLNFGIAEEFGGECHLRFDDTNPETENEEFVRSIQDDIRWLGYDWGEHLYFASDYFDRMYDCAITLIEKGLAYVDSQPMEAIREGRGTVTEPGSPSPYRDRSVEENLDLFARMAAGEFEDGAHVLRGKIDMASPNMLMRDPVFYRIRHAHHYRQGDDWCIYPLYDYAHCLEDAFEDVTHSICTMEFENNRELYDWVLDNVGFEEPRPHQYEWAGLDLENAVLSKRFIKPLVAAGVVSGWDDPRLSTVAAYRRRGVPPEALERLSAIVGVSKASARTEEDKLDYAIREVLNTRAPRVMAVLDPLEVVLTNVEAGVVEEIDAPSFPHDVPKEGSRRVPFTRRVFIERADFAEHPPKGFRRLVHGGTVRLRHARVIRCDEVLRDDAGEIVSLRCSVVEGEGAETKPKGTVQWVSAEHALDAEVRLYGPLLLEEGAGSDEGVDGVETAADGDASGVTDILARVDPASLVTVTGAKVEPSVADDDPATTYQFERTGYFRRDPVDGVGARLVFNRIVGLKSTYRPKATATGRPSAAEGKGAPTGAKRASEDGPAPVTSGSKGEDAAATGPRPGELREAARAADPSLRTRYDRFRAELGLSEEHADLLTGKAATADFFEAALAVHRDPGTLAAWIVVELRGLLGEGTVADLPFDGAALGRLEALVAEGAVTRRAAKDVLARMVESGAEPAELVDAMGLGKVDDERALGALVDGVLGAWPEKVEAYRAGNENLIGLFIGEVMKASGGAADPKTARALLTERLKG